MAETWNKLAKITLSSNYSTVTFSSISQNYTHLVLLSSQRQTATGYYANCYIRPNNSSSGFSGVVLEGSASGTPGAFSDSGGSTTGIRMDAPAAGSVSQYNYSVSDTWFHNYSASSHKGGIQESYVGNQSASTFLDRRGWHWSSTSPITSLVIICAGADNFVSGSTFTLYGIGQLGSTNTGTATVAAS